MKQTKQPAAEPITQELRSRRLHLLEQTDAIRLNPGDAEPAYYSKLLLQCTLPHSKPEESMTVYVRRNGTHTMSVQAGWDVGSQRSLGIPYGAIPRLVLAWIITEAKVTKSRRINFGSKLADFLRGLGYDSRSRGIRSDAKRVRRSIEQLLGAKITFQGVFDVGNETCQKTKSMLIATEKNLWWSKEDPSEAIMWGSWIDLSEEFFNSIQKSAVPCDMRALRALKGSPLALDLYMLFNFVASNYPKKKKIEWKQLAQQLGLDYSDETNLRRTIKRAAEKVCMAHSKLKITYEGNGGITIHPSPPAIARLKES